MAENQGARIVICSKHGIPYDASQRGGCTRCIREWERKKAPERGERSGLPTSVKLLGLLLVAVGVYVLATRPPSGQGAASPGAASPGAASPGAASAPVSSAEAAKVDEAGRRALDAIVGEIPDLIHDGRSDTEILLADAADPERLKNDWDFWSVDWNDRVRQLTGKMPDRPDPQEQLKLALVYQDVSKAIEEMQALPAATVDGLPDAVAVRDRFQAVEKALEQARLHLSQLDQ